MDKMLLPSAALAVAAAPADRHARMVRVVLAYRAVRYGRYRGSGVLLNIFHLSPAQLRPMWLHRGRTGMPQHRASELLLRMVPSMGSKSNSTQHSI